MTSWIILHPDQTHGLHLFHCSTNANQSSFFSSPLSFYPIAVIIWSPLDEKENKRRLSTQNRQAARQTDRQTHSPTHILSSLCPPLSLSRTHKLHLGGIKHFSLSSFLTRNRLYPWNSTFTQLEWIVLKVGDCVQLKAIMPKLTVCQTLPQVVYIADLSFDHVYICVANTQQLQRLQCQAHSSPGTGCSVDGRIETSLI